MGIRDILVLTLGCACVPLALCDAYLGLLGYCWLSFMRPQSLVWSEDVQFVRITLVVGTALIVRSLLTPGPRLRFRAPTIAFLALWAWYGVATFASTHVDLSAPEFWPFCKIGIAVVLITGLVRTRNQLKWLIILLALCPGLYAVRLGLSFLGGMQSTLHGGPIGSDNNDTALFIAMSMPMLVFAATEVRNKWGRYALYAAAALAVPAVIVTTSRGGLLAVSAAVASTLWRKTRWWKALLAVGAAAVVAMAIIPANTWGRYETIGEYEGDASSMSRLWAWETSWAMAADRPLTGVGFGLPTFLAEYSKYQVHEADHPHLSHSVWFSVLGETGWVGLGLYLALLVCVVAAARRVRRLASGLPKEQGGWALAYAAMLECTILTFAVGATFLSKVTFEYIYAIYLLAVPLLVLTEAAAARERGRAAEAGARNRTPRPGAIPRPPRRFVMPGARPGGQGA